MWCVIEISVVLFYNATHFSLLQPFIQIILVSLRYKGTKTIKKSPKYEMSYEDDVAALVIHKTEPADAGLYQCEAANVLGRVQTEGTLAVHSKSWLSPLVESVSTNHAYKHHWGCPLFLLFFGSFFSLCSKSEGNCIPYIKCISIQKKLLIIIVRKK